MIGENIAALRKKHKLTQTDFAEKIHVTQGAVSQWETGRTNPDTFQLIQIANFFNVDLKKLTGDDQQSAVTFTGTIKPEDIVYNSPLDIEAVKRNLQQSKSAIEIQNDERQIAFGVIERLRRLTPERQKQALEYLDFLEQQEGK